MADGHKCPGPDCRRRVPDHMLMCRTHWYQVPPGLRRDVWATYRSGDVARHQAAMDAAVEAIGGAW